MTFMAGAEAEVALIGICKGGDDDDRDQIDQMLEEIGKNEDEAYEQKLRTKTKGLVRRHRALIEIVAKALMEKRSLSAGEIDQIVDAARPGSQNSCGFMRKL